MTVKKQFLLGLVTLTACQVDLGGVFGNESKDGVYPNVAEELWPYFARFEKEASQRGLTVDLRDAVITGVIADISADHVIGQCSYSNQDPHKVTVDKPFWVNASDMGKEFVIFHELGHCYLGRLHDESMDNKGVCLSIMRSGTGTCRDVYSSATRSVLLDELFFDKN